VLKTVSQFFQSDKPVQPFLKMISLHNIIICFLKLVGSQDLCDKLDEFECVCSPDEIEISLSLLQHLEDKLKSTVDEDEILEADVMGDDLPDLSPDDEMSDDAEESSNEDDAEESLNEDDEVPKKYNELTLEEMDKRVREYDELVQAKLASPKRKKLNVFKSISHKYPSIKNVWTITRYREMIEGSGKRWVKLRAVRREVWEKFKAAREVGMPVHDIDLIRWGKTKANEINVSFKGSKRWLNKFKQLYRIKSRKITKHVSSRRYNSWESTIEAANKFQDTMSQKIPQYVYDYVINADQVGFNKELTSKRTLNEVGKRTIEAVVSNKDATTHSYTVMPMITASGKVISPMLLCLQEQDGRLPTTLKESIEKEVREKYTNICLTVSKSGKLTKTHTEYFARMCLVKSLKRTMLENEDESAHVLLILDSWSGHKDKGIFDNVLNDDDTDIQLDLEVIPPQTTSMVQPLDVFFNYWMKYIAKRISHCVLLDGVDFSLHQRMNIIHLQSLIYNQLSSDTYADMVRYAWTKSGFPIPRPEHFETPSTYAFPHQLFDCEVENCTHLFFIRCGWCKKYLCIRHFLLAFHFHE
jgi:ribosomal protein L13E